VKLLSVETVFVVAAVLALAAFGYPPDPC